MNADNIAWYRFDVLRWRLSEARGRCLALGGERGMAAVGVYRELLDVCNTKGSIPADLPGLAAAAGCSLETIEQLWPIISEKFAPLLKDPKRLEQATATAQLRRAKEFSRMQAEKGRKRQARPADDGKPLEPQDYPAGNRLDSGSAAAQPDVSRTDVIERTNETNEADGRNLPPRKRGASPPASLDQILTEFQAMPAFAALDVRDEYNRCDAWWITNRRKHPSRRALNNWLLNAQHDYLPPNGARPPGKSAKKQEEDAHFVKALERRGLLKKDTV